MNPLIICCYFLLLNWYKVGTIVSIEHHRADQESWTQTHLFLRIWRCNLSIEQLVLAVETDLTRLGEVDWSEDSEPSQVFAAVWLSTETWETGGEKQFACSTRVEAIEAQQATKSDGMIGAFNISAFMPTRSRHWHWPTCLHQQRVNSYLGFFARASLELLPSYEGNTGHVQNFFEVRYCSAELIPGVLGIARQGKPA